MCFRENYNDEQQTIIKHNKKPNNKIKQKHNKQTQANKKTTWWAHEHDKYMQAIHFKV